jgi:hypothetical protein
MTRTLSCLALAAAVTLSLAVAAPAAALADTAKTTVITRHAEVEVVEMAKGARTKHTARLTVALTENSSTSQISAKVAGAFYKVRVRQDATSGPAPLLSVELEGASAGPADSGIIQVNATTESRPGKRIVISRVEQPDGTQFEIAVTVK